MEYVKMISLNVSEPAYEALKILAATLKANRVLRILTLNGKDFRVVSFLEAVDSAAKLPGRTNKQ